MKLTVLIIGLTLGLLAFATTPVWADVDCDPEDTCTIETGSGRSLQGYIILTCQPDGRCSVHCAPIPEEACLILGREQV